MTRQTWNIKTGDRFNYLTVISELPKRVLPSGQKIRMIECVCDCGKRTNVALLHLVRSRIKSCGHISLKLNGESHSVLCKRWKAMIERCLPNAIDSHRYYQRGIKVCDEWRNNYNAFKKWAIENGFREDLQIDRIDNNGIYEPTNCRFVTPAENTWNKEVTYKVYYNNETVPLLLLIREKGINEKHLAAIRGRIARGWKVEDAIDTPIKKGNYIGNISKPFQAKVSGA